MMTSFERLAGTLARLADEGVRFCDPDTLDASGAALWLESVEDVEAALLIAPAATERHAAAKLRILGRLIADGANADQVARLFDAARADLLRFPAARAG